MRKNRPLPDRPPAFTGSLDSDAGAAIEWLFAHSDEWLVQDDYEATSLGGYAA